MTFPGLEMTILKGHDFSRYSMTVRTLLYSGLKDNMTTVFSWAVTRMSDYAARITISVYGVSQACTLLTMQCYRLPEGLEVRFHRWAGLCWWIRPTGSHHGQPGVGPATPVWWRFAAQKADQILPTDGSPALFHPGQHVLQSNKSVIHPSGKHDLVSSTNPNAPRPPWNISVV